MKCAPGCSGEQKKAIGQDDEGWMCGMIIRKTQMQDLEEVMQIYERAVRYMAETGNPWQWIDGYPSREMILEDINRGVSFVMEEEGSLEAVFAYIEGVEPTYGSIENGAWKSYGRYGTIHRLASAGRRKGIAKVCFDWCEKEARAHGCHSLRVDTHMDNKIMQRVITQSGFAYCGVIYLANGAPRLAYECVLLQSAEQTGAWNANGGQSYYGAAAPAKEKGDGTGLGIASMVLGIISLLMFCTCINCITSIVAIVLGIIQIVKNKQKSFAVTGIVTAAISMVLTLFLWAALVGGAEKASTDFDYPYYNDEYYDEYYDDYDSDGGFFDDYLEEGSAEFL